MSDAFDPILTREINATLGPLFVAPMSSTIARDVYAKAGFSKDDVREWYYAFRSAPMGRASAETVIATYYNFAPDLVRKYVPRVWDIADPAAVIDLLLEVIDAAMGNALADYAGNAELVELAELLTAACATAFTRPEGRPLFAGIAAIPWPDAPHSQVWFGMHALREFRGDGHIAVLATHNLSGLEALALHGAMGMFPADALRKSRRWEQGPWDATVADLRARGLLEADEVVLSEQGRAFRDDIEHQTDVVTMPAYTEIGEKGVRRILELAPPIVEQVGDVLGRIGR